MGTVSFTNRKDTVILNKRAVQATVTHVGTYATGGDSFSPTALGLKEVSRIIEESHDILDPTIAITAAQVKTGKTVSLAGTKSAPLLQLWETAGTEVTNGTDVTAAVRTLVFIGA